MKIDNIIQGIVLRIGKDILDIGEPFILEQMNQLYKELNEEYKAISSETTFTFTAADEASEINYKAIPVDWIRPYILNPFREWRDPTVFRNDEYYTFTYDNGYIYFARAAEDDSFIARYYSHGLELINQSDSEVAILNAGGILYANEPQWPIRFHRLLMFRTAVDLKSQYPLRERDIVLAIDLEAKLNRLNWHRQEAAPIVEGPQARQKTDTTVDPYL